MKQVQSTRDRIKVVTSTISSLKFALKTWTRRADPNYIQEKLDVQQGIIAKALVEIESLKHQHATAKIEIIKLKRNLKYEQKELTLLENAALIEKLKKLQAQLKETTNENGKT